MAEGTIKRWLRDQNYGFIVPTGGGDDVFFHFNHVRGIPAETLQKGLAVTYDEELSDRGPRANNVRIKKEEDSFLNPYNFVRYLDKARPYGILGYCPPPPHDRYLPLTGCITCEVEAVTPLFISDSHAINENGNHRFYRFFQLDGQPALPASSLRGMIRSVFEAATNSCFEILDKYPLSYHLKSRRAPWLVPARVEQDSDGWCLRLLTGTTPLQIESQIKKNPEGPQYAAWMAFYWPLKPSKTLREIDPKLKGGRRLSQEQRTRRRHFINRTKSSVNPDGLTHGDECYAQLRLFLHPHPKIQFWDVVQIRRKREDLPDTKEDSGRIEKGWLCITNQNIEPKHSERFFFRDSQNKTGPEKINLPYDDVIKNYECLIRDYQKRHRGVVQTRKRDGTPLNMPINKTPAISRFVYQNHERELRGGELVYAMLDGTFETPKVKFIVPVSVPRVSYEHGIGDLLPKTLHLHRCVKYKELCPACRVFGWVHEDPTHSTNRTAYASRVRISHGKLSDETIPETLDDITLAILSSPKPTTTLFYLLDAEGNPADIDYDHEDAKLRGRKFYRHQGKWIDEKEYLRSTKDSQNRTVRDALKPGAKFAFTLNFENLAEEELGALLWTLELEEGMFHRLGFAKPLGFGSVKITVKSVKVLNLQNRYTSFREDGWESVNGYHKWVDIFKKGMSEAYGYLSFDEMPNIQDLHCLLGEPDVEHIHYPRTNQDPEERGENFKWFVGNKRRRPPIPLPLTEADIGLPIMDEWGNEVY